MGIRREVKQQAADVRQNSRAARATMARLKEAKAKAKSAGSRPAGQKQAEEDGTEFRWL